MQDSRVTIVLPAVGAGASVATAVRDIAVASYALRLRGIRLDLLVVGDADTERHATKAAAELGVPVATRLESEAGAAHVVGMRTVAALGEADFVVTLDATGQHDASRLPRLLEALEERRLDVLIGSRWARDSGTPGLSLRRWTLGRLANRTFRTITGIRGITDVTTAFRITRMKVLKRIDLDSMPADPRAIQMAFVANAIALGFRVGEAAIVYDAKRGPISAIGLRDITSFLGYLPQLRSQTREVRRLRLAPQGRQFNDPDFGAAGDLEKLGTADRFFGWTLDGFRPFLRGRVLEVGAGLGTITRKLVEADERISVVALEPAGNLFGELSAYAAVNSRVVASQLISSEYLKTDPEPFDTVLYINVLEHIEGDVEELRVAAGALRPGGHVLVFGPGLRWLYSELDYNAGHYRRYTVNSLRKTAETAGLEVVSARYFDVVGVLPYWLVYRVMRSQVISGTSMWGYDKVIVPISRLLQAILRRPPLGKNVIMVARRPIM